MPSWPPLDGQAATLRIDPRSDGEDQAAIRRNRGQVAAGRWERGGEAGECLG